MIHRLRKKFILINMILIFLVLLVVFGTLLFSQTKRLEKEVVTRMAQVLDHPDNSEDKKFSEESKKKRDPGPADFVPVYIVLTTEDGEILSQEANNSSLTSDVLDAAIQQALSSEKQQGILSDLNLRFLKCTTPEGIRIAFSDRNYELCSIRTILLNCAAVLFLALIAFFLITLFLSRWALRPVEEAWTQQNQFVADASHELKTPLTVILANLNIILSHPDDTIRHQMKWIENTYAESTRMKKLVDHLLFLAKSDAKQLPSVFSSFNLSDAAWSCLLPFESIAFEQKLSIIEDITPDLWIHGNEEQLKQLIIILLDNACKYTPPKGTVHFLLAMEQNKIVLKVCNTGEPIPPEDLSHIFERFYRSDKSRSRKEGGYGLGLAIAHSIAVSHHGKIQAASNLEEGTIFSVTLPSDHKSERREPA